jgi:hypothetical protein
MYSQAEYGVFSPRIHYNQQVDTTKNNITMKLTFVLRNKQNALKLSTKTLDSFIERIKTDTKDGAVARRRHEFNHFGSTDSYDQQHPLHQIYPSVEYERDANDNLRMRTFNGVVALVIDNLQNTEEIETVKQTAKILHYTLAAFVGATGKEVIILVRIAKADGSMPTDEEEADFVCKQGWKLASTIYQGLLPKPINQQPASARSWFRMPLDATPYYNPQAVALPVSEKPIAEKPHTDESTVVETTNDEGDAEISQETERLMDYLNSRYVFRYNSIMGYTEYKDQSRKYMEWEPVDDRVMKGMTMKVRLAGIDARDNDIRRYVQSDMIRPFNPIGDYLWEQYDKWDGKDHIRKLARTVPTDNPHWEDWFYTWFLGMVRQWQVNNLAKYGNQAVPLLISNQGWNKTTFCEQLLPPELRWGYTGNLQMDDKRQVLQQMAQMLLINLDEFNQISPRTQQGFLKNIITLSSVKIKRPYGRHVEDFPRRASFIATTNQADVLADPSGSRRFLSVELTGPIDVSVTPNYEQLYAQAMRALHQREPYYFSPTETQKILEWNNKFRVKSAADHYFFDYFEPAAPGEDGEWISASAIFEHLKHKVGISLLKPANVSNFGRMLSGIPNLKKRETRYGSEYFVRCKKA